MLTINNLSFSYDDKIIFDDVTLTIDKFFYLLQGASGSGKSTFLSLLSGFNDRFSGKVSFDGQVITKNDLGILQQNIRYVPAKVYMFDESIKANLLKGFLFEIHKNKSLPSDDILKEELQALNLNFALDHQALLLSTGEQQRISLIRTLLLRPKVCLIDEIFANLDSETINLVCNYLKDYRKKYNTIFIISSHITNNMLNFDSILKIENQQIVQTS